MAAAVNTPTPESGTGKTDEGGYDQKCIFCKIVKREMGTEILHNDETVSCFRDIRPGAPHHYLVVPNKHVGNCKSLRKEHMPLVEKMVDIGKEILQKNNVTDLNDVSQMGFMSRLVYRLNSYWFITADQLLQNLNSMS
ncbi:histidine triad nucleotide-binding protein 3 isoform X2 [Pimephales promelas]|uniref:histidine triad nucleotide-binding protein 3 isoform X2 n=1 Tax=Pimephales promelas TaxID=90988 RepID=UPI0019559ADB|nr:histidine triad nucleotide-binding protein 3 isoform X2 [Pimephales promelas]KAG1936570.1 histidine triad nucleotide-binding protein [Pimephales promelas]